MYPLRMLLAIGIVTILCPIAAIAVDGVNEINQTSILAAGGFPYTIPAAGSYVLTGNLAPPGATGALVLGAANVVIDLNGFAITTSLPLLIGGGLLVGFGTSLGSGCTSGHGVCGIARGSRRSLVATLTFMATGAFTVFVVRHVLGVG